MAVNLDKPHLWKEDTQASVDHYNQWFMKFAPKAFRDTRVRVTKSVERAILDSDDMRNLSPELLLSRPGILPTLRMSCCPPLAVDRLVGLARASKNLVKNMEEAKKISQLKATLGQDICYIVFLCGYFDSGYLGYEAADGIDWVWEHRIEDLEQLEI